MKRFSSATLVAMLLGVWPLSLQAQAPNAIQKISVGGIKLRAEITGQPKEGQPTVVLVSGLGGGVEDWRLVQPNVASFAQTVAYDRAGLGQSEPDSAPPTPRRIAEQLHALLHNAGIKPPYLLVGHSIGGPFVRMFTGLYPKEVAGLVYVDPTDFTQTRADQLAIWTELGMGEAGLKAFEQAQTAEVAKKFAEASPSLRAEGDLALQLPRNGWEDFRSLPPLPDIPVVILMAAKVDLPPDIKRVMGSQRVWHLTKWTTEVSEGTLVVTTRSDHYIQLSEPELVTWAIRRVLHGDPDRRPSPPREPSREGTGG